jgi:CBS domain-containing protein
MELMVENHVSGLAVVDEAERCIGVVSGTDLLRYEQDHRELTAEANSDLARYFDQMTGRWEDVRVTSYALEKFAELEIDEIMSRDLISVRPETPVRDVASKMLDQHVHRVLVLDPEGRLLGLITAIDFVRLAAGSNERPGARRHAR